MAKRQTLNVSLPPAQETFIRSQVEGGRYRTASEVVRDGLRLLEEAEHRRLVEKWIYEGLSDEETARLPEGLRDRVRSHFRRLVDEGVRSGVTEGWIDGAEGLAGLRASLSAPKSRAS